MFSFFNTVYGEYEKKIYDFSIKSISEEILDLSKYENKIILIVNVASKCGFTQQYTDLQSLYEKYKDRGLIILGVPSNQFGEQEPGSNSEIKDFCETNFNVSFPMSEKINVLGKESHPFYKWAKSNHGKAAIPKWNFHKIIVGKNGKVADTFSSITKPMSKKFINSIEEIIKN